MRLGGDFLALFTVLTSATYSRSREVVMNLGWLRSMFTNTLLSRAGKFSPVKGALKRILLMAFGEGVEEAWQQIVSKSVEKGKFSTEGVAKSALIGGLVGGTRSGLDSVREALGEFKPRLFRTNAVR